MSTIQRPALIKLSAKTQESLSRAQPTAPSLMLIFLLCILPPSFFFIADMRLTFMRVFLLVCFIPLLIQLLSGAVGRIRGVDIALIASMVWIAVTLVYHHGLPLIGLAGITVIELFGGYLVGRVLVRNEADFQLFMRFFLGILIFLFPFVAIELLTDRNLLQEVSRSIFDTFSKAESSYGRMGLNRVMSGFEHPILYGLFTSMAFAPLYYMNRRRDWRTALLIIFAGFMTFASLSSAPLLALGIQVSLILWGWITGNRWWVLTGIVVFCYVMVDLLSNRTPITILINYVTFDPHTAWIRVHIWNFGSQEVLNNPIWGIGLNNWARPNWLTSSVDNFWLVMAMRHGFPGALSLILGLALAFCAIMRTKNLPARIADIRTGYLVALIGLYITLTTVHIWGDTSSFVMAFIGAGMWIVQAGKADDAVTTKTVIPGAKMHAPTTPHSRFPPRLCMAENSPETSQSTRPEVAFALKKRIGITKGH